MLMFEEKRLGGDRKVMNIPLGGLLVDKATSRIINCWSADVSRGGLGVVTDERLANGSEVLLQLGKQIHLRVMWGRRNPDSEFAYRYGLLAVDQSANVEEVFEEYVTGVSLFFDEQDAPTDSMSLKVGART